MASIYLAKPNITFLCAVMMMMMLVHLYLPKALAAGSSEEFCWNRKKNHLIPISKRKFCATSVICILNMPPVNVFSKFIITCAQINYACR